MTATVAHEIRNPIATLRLAAENALAVSGDAVSVATRPSLTLMLAQVSKLDDLVESLLGMVQPVRVRRQPADVTSWARGVISAMATTLGDRLAGGRRGDHLVDGPGPNGVWLALSNGGDRWAQKGMRKRLARAPSSRLCRPGARQRAAP
jgi:signal transduction histidine kinase